MWCPTCQADVAAELSPDHRRLSCARCRTDLALAATEPTRGQPRLSGVERTARDLLARWSAESPVEQLPKSSETSEVWNTQSQLTQTAEVAEDFGSLPLTDAALPFPVSRRIRRRRARRHILHSQTAAIAHPPTPPWLATVGQFTAYSGVGGLTCGAAMLLWSYFGGPTHLAPTGWLITTLGQMLLFLGVVTLVASSLERLAADLNRRLDRVTEELESVARRRHRRAPRADDESKSRAAA